MFFSRKDPAEPEPVLAGPPAIAGRLWEPVPITVPTYVSKPLAPRTVRTIDLSGPPVSAPNEPALPVTADPPGTDEKPDRRDSGEARTALGA